MADTKVLIVDDEETFVRMVKLTLEDSGEFEVKTESNPTNALQAAQWFSPDIIVLDVIMPEMSGIEVSEQLKADPQVGKTPIIFLTAAVSKENAHLQDDMLEGNPVLAKPVGAEELTAAIEKALSAAS